MATYTITTATRISQLETCLTEPFYDVQKENILRLIDYYRNGGQFPSLKTDLWFRGGRWLRRRPTQRLASGPAIWRETSPFKHYQISQWSIKPPPAHT